MSKYDKDVYPGCHEVVPGVFVDMSCGDVYIADEQGEVVMWTHDEVAEDVSAFTACINAIMLATKHGPEAVRQNIVDCGNTLEAMITKTME